MPYEKVSSPGVTSELQELPGLEDIDGGSYTVQRKGRHLQGGDRRLRHGRPEGRRRPARHHRDLLLQQRARGHHGQEPGGLQARHGTATWKEGARTARHPDRHHQQPRLRQRPRGPLDHAARLRRAVHGHTDVNSVTFDVTHVVQAHDDGLDARRLAPADAGHRERLVGPPLAVRLARSRRSTTAPTSSPRRPTTSTASRAPAARRPSCSTASRRAAQAGHGRPDQFGTVEIEWTANTERDIIGYQVFRTDSATPVCDIATQKLETFCIDKTPPDVATLEYYVKAYDRDTSGNLRASEDSEHLFVTKSNNPPYR